MIMKNRRAFIVGIKSTSLSKKEIFFLKKYKPWGVILFSRNLKEINQIKKEFRFISDNNELPNDKIVFLKAISNVIKSGMDILGVETPEQM